MAEIVQRRRAAEGVDWRSAGEEAMGDEEAGGSECCGGTPAQEEATAVDPVCGMTVAIAGAPHVYEHGGETYYFCCGGCRARFSADPKSFLAA